MATEVINVEDKGFATIRDERGNPTRVNVFALITVTNEAAPEEVLCFCHPTYHKSILKSFRRLMWVKPKIEEMVKVHSEPAQKENVIPDNAGIQEEKQDHPLKGTSPLASDASRNDKI